MYNSNQSNAMKHLLAQMGDNLEFPAWVAGENFIARKLSEQPHDHSLTSHEYILSFALWRQYISTVTSLRHKPLYRVIRVVFYWLFINLS